MKSLRLHKYTERLINLTYEELLAITDNDLKDRMFTDGAKGKFLKQIALIRDRPQKIRELKQHLDVSRFWHLESKKYLLWIEL